MRRLALALVAAALASPLVALPAAGAEPATPEQGRLLPQRMAHGIAHSLQAVSNTHVLTFADPTTSSWPEGRRDLRRLDGALVRADVVPPGTTVALSDRFLTATTFTATSPRRPASVAWYHVGDGSLDHEMLLPADLDLVLVRDWGVLLRRQVDTVTQQHVLRLRSGADLAVTGLGTGRVDYVDRGPEQGALLLGQAGRLYLVDPATGAATEAADSVSTPWVLGMTSSRIWWANHNHLGWTLHWADRADLSRGSVAVQAADHDFLLLGDGVALRPYHPVDDVYGYRPVDTRTGQASDLPFAQVLPPVQLEGGRAAAILRDRPSGRVVTFGAGGSALVEHWLLPPSPVEPTALAVLDGTTVAQWSGAELAALPTGGSAWTPLPEQVRSRTVRTASGDVLLTTDYGGMTALATWTGGSRVLATDDDVTASVVLGNGGRLYGVAGPSSIEVRDVRSGLLVATVPLGTRYAIDGTWLWTLNASGTVQGSDLVSGRAVSVPTGSTCSSTFSVVGRWAALGCYDDRRGVLVVDLSGAVGTWTVHVGTQCQRGWPCDRPHVLGDGFLAWAEPPSPAGDVPPLVKVVDLSGSHEVRTYGPGSAPAVGADRSAGLTYLAPRGVRVAPLDWLGTAPVPRADTTAPTVGPLGGSSASGTGATMSVSWSAADQGSPLEPATGVASYDARYQQSPSAGAPFGSWTEPAGWSATVSTSVSLDVPVGSTTCVQVRARDVAGNLSPWSASRCYQRLAPGFTAVVGPGDVTGDARADLLARDAAGALWLYPGSGTGAFGKARKVGTGWGGFTAVVGPGDLTGDRRADLLGRDAAGRLLLYPGTGTGTFGRARVVGTGWAPFTALVGPGDLTGDRRGDLLGRDAAGALWLYPGTGTGTFGKARRVGSGW